MLKTTLTAGALALLIAGVATANSHNDMAKPSPAIVSALADAGRPAEDKARDAARKPGELLAFAGVKPGQTVADLVMGGGYFTRVLAKTVGPSGKVIAYQPTEFIAFQKSYGENQTKVAAAYPNVTALTTPFGAPNLPGGLDVAITVQNYHDLHLKPFPADTAAKFNAAVFHALKPGGTYVIVDHVAAPGAGLAAADSVHRIEADIVKKEVLAAGFKLDGESTMLKVSGDDYTKSVFTPPVRGKTDQFVLRFKKPA